MTTANDDFNSTSGLDTMKEVVRLRRLLEPLEFPLKDISLLLPLINNVPSTVYIKDRHGVHVLVNARDLEIKRVARIEDVIGKTDFDFFPPELAQQFFDDEQRVMKTERPLINKEEHFVDQDGYDRWLLTTKIPLYDQDGQVIGIIGIGSEFTKHRQELELLTDITQNIVRASDLRDAMRQIAFGAMKLLDAASAVIFLIETKDDGNYRIVDTFSHPPQLEHPLPRIQEKPEGITYHVITTGEMVEIEDATRDNRLNPQLKNTRAMIAIPLKFRDRISGVLYVNDIKPRPFTESAKQRLRRLAEYAVIAIENSRLLTELWFSRYQLRTLLEASNTLLALSNPDDVLRKLIENALVASDADWAIAVLFDHNGQLTQFMQYPQKGDFEKADIRPDGNSIRIFKSGKTYYTEDISKNPNNINPKSLEQNFRSVIGLPLTVDDGSIGVMWLHYYQPHPFSKYYIEALEAYTRYGATTYNNTARAAALTQMLARVMQLGGGPKHRTLRTIVEMMQELVKCDAVTLYVYNTEREELEHPPTLLGVWNETGATLGYQVNPNSVVYEMMLRSERYVAENVAQDPHFQDKRFTIEEQIKSCVAFPLQVDDQKVGVMFVNDRIPRRFSSDDLNYMQIFANYAAEAISNAQLLNQAQERATTLELLGKIQSRIASAQDIDLILNEIVRGSKELTRIQEGDGVIFLIDRKDGQFQISEFFPKDLHIPLPRFDNDRSMARHVIESREPFQIRNVARAAETGELASWNWVEHGAKSMVVVPVIIRDQVIGVLYVINKQRPRKFTEAEIGYLKTLAGEAGIAIQNARLFQQQIKAFDEIAESIPISNTVTDILKQVLRWPFLLYGSIQSANIRLLDTATNELYVAAYLPEDAQRDPRYERVKVGDRVTGWAAAARQTIYIPDVAREPRYRAYIPGAGSELAVPLMVADQCIGILNLERPETYGFNRNDIQLAEAIAKLVVVAVENVSQVEQIRADKLKRVETINAMADSFNASAKSVKKLLDGLFEWIVVLSPNTASGEENISLIEIRLLDRKTNELVLARRYRGISDNEMKRIPISEGIIGWVVRSKASKYVPDVKAEPLYREMVPETRSELAVPMLKGQKVIGVINIEHRELAAFDDDNIQMLEATARLVTAAIDHARRYQQLKKIRGQLIARTALAWLGMASSTWYHEIRGNANTITDLVDLARSDAAIGASVNKIMERLDEIRETAQEIVYKHEAYPLDADADVKSVNVNQVLDGLLVSYYRTNLDIKPFFDPQLDDETATVRASAWGLRQVFNIIITNAIKVMTAVDQPEIIIRTKWRGSWAEIEFEDNGPGIPAKALRAIRNNQSISKQPGEPGLGMGLLLSRVILDTYLGQLKVASTGADGTIIVIRLPLENQQAL